MPVVAIVAAVALSAGLFFAFTLPQCSGKKPSEKEKIAAGGVDGGEQGAPGPDAGTGPGKDPGPEPEPEPEPGPEPEPPKVEAFANSRALVGKLVAGLASDDIEAVKSLVGVEVLAEPRAFGFLHVFGAGGYQMAADEPFGEIGDVDELNRWALYAVPKADPQADARERITVDLKRAQKVGWKVAGVHVPAGLRAAAAAAGVKLADGSTPAADPSLDRPDPLFVADDFVSSLLSQDYEKALDLCGDRVPDEKIAGLCMVFEEGEFRMLKNKPLTTTSLGAEKAAAWVFARVRSDKMDTNGEFAVELKVDADRGWQVENVNIESMLQDFVAGSEAGRVPYTPIKKNPDGGDTLVLYFEYDKADLLPRSLRQIDILSRILKADAAKTLNIGGHADALGTDEYNRKLSEARGVAVRDALIMFGVPKSQIEVTAFGEAKPWKDNTTETGDDNPEGRQHNRRAEIYLNF